MSTSTTKGGTKGKGAIGKAAGYISGNPLRSLKIFFVILIAVAVIYFVVTNWNTIKAIGIAATVAYAIARIAPIIAEVILGIFGITLPAVAAKFRNQKKGEKENAENNKDDPEKQKTDQEKTSETSNAIGDKVNTATTKVPGTTDPSRNVRAIDTAGNEFNQTGGELDKDGEDADVTKDGDQVDGPGNISLEGE